MIQPVISNRELARRLGEHGLAFPIGHCPTVKAGGYLLNGGMSWNMGHWGPACLSVEAVEFVTADGKLIKASATEHQDLFWAARGCGPGMFAVATRFHLKCYPLPRAIAASNYYFSLNDLREAVDEVVALGRKMPDKVELSIFLIKAPAELAEAVQGPQRQVVHGLRRGLRDDQGGIRSGPRAAGTGRHGEEGPRQDASTSLPASNNWRSPPGKRGRRTIAIFARTSAPRPSLPTC